MALRAENWWSLLGKGYTVKAKEQINCLYSSPLIAFVAHLIVLTEICRNNLLKWANELKHWLILTLGFICKARFQIQRLPSCGFISVFILWLVFFCYFGVSVFFSPKQLRQNRIWHFTFLKPPRSVWCYRLSPFLIHFDLFSPKLISCVLICLDQAQQLVLPKLGI